MRPTDKEDYMLHGKLPIGKDEKILAVYRHHWFAYASVWAIAIFIVLAIMGIAWFLTSGDAMSGTNALVEHRSQIMIAAVAFSVFTLVFACIPLWLKSQEQVVLTEEAVLQILQPSLFGSKVSQLNLAHVADVSVRQDFFGTIFGFGKVSIETPGEQDNYEFFEVPNAQIAAKMIIEAHENFQAALQAGRLPSTLGTDPNKPDPNTPPNYANDPEYQQFLAFKKAMAEQQSQQPSNQPAPAGSNQQPNQSPDPNAQYWENLPNNERRQG